MAKKTTEPPPTHTRTHAHVAWHRVTGGVTAHPPARLPAVPGFCPKRSSRCSALLSALSQHAAAVHTLTAHAHSTRSQHTRMPTVHPLTSPTNSPHSPHPQRTHFKQRAGDSMPVPHASPSNDVPMSSTPHTDHTQPSPPPHSTHLHPSQPTHTHSHLPHRPHATNMVLWSLKVSRVDAGLLFGRVQLIH